MAYLPGGWYLLAFSIGCAVGIAELLSRYPWSLGKILSKWAGWSYAIINGVAAVGGYRASIDWQLHILDGKPEGWKVLVTSVMAMAVLRSAFATLRIGNRDVGIGLVAILDTPMKYAERVLDRGITLGRWNSISQAVAGLTYEATQNYFVSIACTVMPSLSDADRDTIQREAGKIGTMDVDGDTKLQLLAFCIADRLGDELFGIMAKDAANRFAVEIKNDKERKAQNLEQLAKLKASLKLFLPGEKHND